MAAKAGYSRADVLAEAVREADRHGWHALTMGDLAARLKIKTPSLYNHVDGLSGLRRLLAIHAATLLDEALTRVTVGKSGDAAVRAMAHAHRAFLKAHPGLADATVTAPPKKDREWSEAAERAVATCLKVLEGYGLEREPALHALRGIRSAVHGFATLERNGGFGLALNVEESFTWLIDALIGGIGGAPRARRGRNAGSP